MPTYQSPKSGKLIEVESDFDVESGVDRAREEALSKGWRPVHKLVSKSGRSIVVDDSGLDEALSKGWKTADLRDTEREADASFRKGVAQDNAQMGQGEAALRGLAQGGSGNFVDEVSGVGGAVKELFGGDRDVIGNYRAYRDTARAKDKVAEELHPKTYATANLAGAVASPLNKLAPGSTVQSLARGAALGSAGASEAESLSEFVEDVGKGTAAGVGGGLAIKALPKAYQALKGGGVRAASMASDLNPEAVEFYLKNRAAVKAARPLEDVARDVTSGLDEAAGKISQESQKSREMLKNVGIDRQSVADALKARADELIAKAQTPEELAAAEKLLAQAEFTAARPGKGIEGDDLKDFLQRMGDKAYADKVTAGGFETPLARELQSFRGEVDEATKFLSPQYEAQMREVAEGTRMLQNVRPRFDKPEKAYNALKGIAREKSPFQKENLEALDKYLGKDLALEARASGVADAFASPRINGSRNVNLGARIGEAGGGVTGAIGAVLGYAKDHLARPATGKALDLAIALKPYEKDLGKFAKPLLDAARKGPLQFALTHQLLSKEYPEYRSMAGLE
jgi:hypothetical protein